MIEYNSHLKELCKDWFVVGFGRAIQNKDTLTIDNIEQITNETFEKAWEELIKKR